MDTQLEVIPAVKEEKALTKITNYLEAAPVRARFAQIMGERGASVYITSVLTVVANSKSLQKCSPASIYTSAIRAATLRLSVDPSTKQAHLVAYGEKATLIPGWKGYYDMAIRTNRYRYINIGKIYEGEEIIEDRISGFHKIAGKRTGDKRIGWIGAFEMLPRFGGYSKTIYMTVGEIHGHGEKYSPSYGKRNKDGILVDNWGKPTIWHTEVEAMEKKTVLIALITKWGYMDPADVKALEEMKDEDPNSIETLNALAEHAEQQAPKLHDSASASVSILMGNGNPDPITDGTWEEYQKWRARAVEVSITVPEIVRAEHTEKDLRQYIDTELSRFVLDAEEQALAGEGNQDAHS